MKAALADAANAVGVALGDVGKGKTFEAVVLLTCAMRLEGAFAVEVRDHAGEPTTDFVMRGGPGHLPDPEAKGPLPSYILLRHASPDRSLELHNSLEFVGSSGVEHEMDVSVVTHAAAGRVRGSGGGPMPGPPEVGIELKEHAAGKQLDKNAARAFVACCVDLMPLRHVTGMTVGMRNPRRETGLSHPRVTTLFLTTAGVSAPSADLAAFYGIGIHADVAPDGVWQVLEQAFWHCVFHAS